MRLGTLVLGRHPVLVGVLTEFHNKRVLSNALRSGIDAVELRIDHCNKPDTALQAGIIGTIRARALPIIATVRSIREGGKYPITDKKRVELFRTLIPLTDAVDIELSSKEILKDVVKAAKRSRKRVIISHHNFQSTPPKIRLERIIDQGRSEGGDIIKIAAMVKDDRDLRRLARVTLEHKNLVTIAMGSRGIASRIFFPLLGSLLTYAPIGEATAPGQLPIKVTREELNRYYL
ncbi:MAG: type I 3-dehydroquinate dehydratase [Thermodesulfobacteriota bacterium]